jgi:hypothetical protein
MHRSRFIRLDQQKVMPARKIVFLPIVTALLLCSGKSGFAQGSRAAAATDQASDSAITEDSSEKLPIPPMFHREFLWSALSRPTLDPAAEARTASSPAPSATSSASVADYSGQLPPSIDSDRVGSTNVPMDSWIYPVLERLGSMGLIPSQSVAIRPWTRQECRRQVREAEDILFGFASMDVDVDANARDEAERLLPDLRAELKEPDGRATAILESVYARFGTIAGPALTDGFHFGQTWSNDFGRPLGRGSSTIFGFSARAVSGRFFFYDRQEMQTDPGLPARTPALANLFNQVDNAPFFLPDNPHIPAAALILPAPAISGYVRQRPLELYAGVAFSGNALSFGKQELYWGPTTMGPFSFSSNAEPTYNLRLVATRPHPIPFLPNLGSYRFDIVFGKLSGHAHPARPYFNGQKFDVTLGPYLELSFTRWSILWGVGHPMRLKTLKDNFISSNSTGATFEYGDATDPGDRKSAFDFRLHVPGLSRYLTLYADSYADDELSPLNAPRRVAWHPGMYVARLPYLTHADFRFEVASSEELSKDEGPTRFFINNQYRDGNTNKGFLLGNAVGRDARAIEGRVGYWFSARTRVEGSFRQTKGSTLFLTGGSTISDVSGIASYAISKDWTAQVFGQYERFLIPSYMPGSQTNGSARIQITWSPKNLVQAR